MQVEPITLQGKKGTYVFEPKNILSLNGRFGSVFRGKEISSDKDVVVKFLSPQRGSKKAEFRFKLEAVYAFGRADIQDSLDFISTDKGLFLIKNYVPGLSLKKIKANKISLEEWKTGLINLLDTLDFLHQKEIVHGDIKPGNIIWSKTENDLPEKPVLIDFGLARLKNITYSDALFSFVYSPPEQLLGFGSLMGPHSDLFSLGITLYECVVNEPAYYFEEDNPALMEQAQLSLPLEQVDSLPKDWYVFFSYLCQKPAFKKPHRHYSKQEQEAILKDSIARRPQDANRVKEMALQLSTERPKKSIWRIFG